MFPTRVVHGCSLLALSLFAVTSLQAQFVGVMGRRLFAHTLADVAAGRLVRLEQDAALATWEPAMHGTPRLFRPDLELLGDIPGFEVIRERCAA